MVKIVPAPPPVMASQVAAEQALSIGNTVARAVSTPILSQRTLKEGEDRNGEPVLIERQINITPAAVVGGAAAAWVLGVGVGIGVDADGKRKPFLERRPRWNEGAGAGNAAAQTVVGGGLLGFFQRLLGG